MIEIRLMGDEKEVQRAIALLKFTEGMKVLRWSDSRPNRKDDGVRVYLDAEVPVSEEMYFKLMKKYAADLDAWEDEQMIARLKRKVENNTEIEDA